jgi:hypothetical protein
LNQAKTINLAFAKLDYMIEKDKINLDLLRIKSAQVDNLRQVVEMRQKQLINANTTIGELERKVKAQNRQILLYKIGLIGSVSLLLFSLL